MWYVELEGVLIEEKILNSNGFTAVNVNGGMVAWKELEDE